jgi:ribosomal protein S18 acetylase RimI-like enzyme
MVGMRSVWSRIATDEGRLRRAEHAGMNDTLPVIRPALPSDLPTLGTLGDSLVRMHFDFDPRRFMAPHGDTAEGYAWFLGQQLDNPDVVVFVAEQHGVVVGYVYAGVETQNWKELREEAGFIHDVVVTPSARRHGVGAQLIEAACGWCRERGMPRVLLSVAAQNTGAQRLFDRTGFRRTMVEMTREL